MSMADTEVVTGSFQRGSWQSDKMHPIGGGGFDEMCPVGKLYPVALPHTSIVYVH